MIFVVLGTQKFQFNRLLKAVDQLKLSGGLKEDVFAQTGSSDYIPKTFESMDFMSREMFEKKIENADIIITHAGVGTIISAVGKGKKVIVVPRLKKYKEHVDDHQLEIARSFSEQNLVLLCDNINELAEKIEESKIFKFEKYNSQRVSMLSLVRNFIKNSV